MTPRRAFSVNLSNISLLRSYRVSPAAAAPGFRPAASRMRCRAPLTHRLETEPRSCSYPAPPGDASTPRKELAGQAARDSYSRCLPAAAEHRAGPADPAGLWRHRDFFWSGHSVSEPGSAVTTLALALTAVVVLHASALQVGLLTTATTVSFLLIAVPAGVVVDRIA